jgi:uncharacterized protein YktB (UPF0637 family)
MDWNCRRSQSKPSTDVIGKRLKPPSPPGKRAGTPNDNTVESTIRIFGCFAVRWGVRPGEIVTTLGFVPTDFDVFRIEGNARIEKLYAQVRPKLIRLGHELAPQLMRKLGLEFFPHIANHTGRTVQPPRETWIAFGPSPRGYKRHGYLALCISRAGLHARAVVKSEAGFRPEISRGLDAHRAQLTKDFDGTRIARYESWDCKRLPSPVAAEPEIFKALAATLNQKTGSVDLGFGWNVHDALRLDRAEMIEAFRELEPLYRIFAQIRETSAPDESR